MPRPFISSLDMAFCLASKALKIRGSCFKRNKLVFSRFPSSAFSHKGFTTLHPSPGTRKEKSIVPHTDSESPSHEVANIPPPKVTVNSAIKSACTVKQSTHHSRAIRH